MLPLRTGPWGWGQQIMFASFFPNLNDYDQKMKVNVYSWAVIGYSVANNNKVKGGNVFFNSREHAIPAVSG